MFPLCSLDDLIPRLPFLGERNCVVCPCSWRIATLDCVLLLPGCVPTCLVLRSLTSPLKTFSKLPTFRPKHSLVSCVGGPHGHDASKYKADSFVCPVLKQPLHTHIDVLAFPSSERIGAKKMLCLVHLLMALSLSRSKFCKKPPQFACARVTSPRRPVVYFLPA